MAQIASEIVSHLSGRLESLTLDDPSVAEALKHNPTMEPDATRPESLYRNFRWEYGTMTASPVSVGPGSCHVQLWDLPLELDVLYPFTSSVNRDRIAGFALDDATRIVRSLEVDHTRTDGSNYEWSGVTVEHSELTEAEDGWLSSFAVTVTYKRTF